MNSEESETSGMLTKDFDRKKSPSGSKYDEAHGCTEARLLWRESGDGGVGVASRIEYIRTKEKAAGCLCTRNE